MPAGFGSAFSDQVEFSVRDGSGGFVACRDPEPPARIHAQGLELHIFQLRRGLGIEDNETRPIEPRESAEARGITCENTGNAVLKKSSRAGQVRAMDIILKNC